MNNKRLMILVCALGLLAASCGPEGEREAEQILSGAAETTIANITVVPETPVATLDVNLIVKQTFEAMTKQAVGQKPVPTPHTPTATHALPTPIGSSTSGSISGKLNYPGPSIPALYVSAYRYGSEAYKFR